MFGFDAQAELPRASPRYAEAYPRLNFTQAQTQIGKGKSVCLFMRGTGVVGSCQFLGCERHGNRPVRSTYCTFAPTWNQHQEVSIEVKFWLIERQVGVNYTREYARCPGCGGTKTVLAYSRKEWKCRQCHDLLHRTHLIDPRVRLAEKIGVIEAKIASGRPKGMHNATFERMQRELKKLQRMWAKTLGEGRKVASLEHNKVVEAHWMTPDEAKAKGMGWVLKGYESL